MNTRMYFAYLYNTHGHSYYTTRTLVAYSMDTFMVTFPFRHSRYPFHPVLSSLLSHTSHWSPLFPCSLKYFRPLSRLLFSFCLWLEGMFPFAHNYLHVLTAFASGSKYTFCACSFAECCLPPLGELPECLCSDRYSCGGNSS